MKSNKTDNNLVYISSIDISDYDWEQSQSEKNKNLNSIIKKLTDFAVGIKVHIEIKSEIFIIKRKDKKIKPYKLDISNNVSSHQISKEIKNCLVAIINENFIEENWAIEIAFTISDKINPWGEISHGLSSTTSNFDFTELSEYLTSSFYIFGFHPEFGDDVVTQGYSEGELDTGILWDQDLEFYGGKKILNTNNLTKDMFALNYYENSYIIESTNRPKQIIEKISQTEIADSLITNIKSKLEKIISLNIKEFKATGLFKVRPGYGYDKFYLDHVDGSYDVSLYSLIHYIMYEDNLYPMFLNQKQLMDLEEVIKNTPTYIYRPSKKYENQLFDTDFINTEILDKIYWQCITHVGKKLIDLGFDVKESFSEYLEG